MSGDLASFQAWVEAVKSMAERVPELGTMLGTWSWAGAIGVAAAGVAMLLVGSRIAPVLAAASGVLIGWIAGTQLWVTFGGGRLPVSTVGWACAGVLGLVSLFVPAVYVAVLGGIAGALAGVRLSLGGGGSVGAAVGAAILAILGILLRRIILAATAALAGACLCVVALIALTVRFPELAALTQRPTLLLGLGALLAVAGTAFQAGHGAGMGGSAPRERGARALARE